MNNYSFFKSIIKAVKYSALILLGLVIVGVEVKHPDIARMTIGSFLIFLYDLVKHGLDIKFLP